MCEGRGALLHLYCLILLFINVLRFNYRGLSLGSFQGCFGLTLKHPHRLMCVKILTPSDGTIWGGCETFSRCSLAGRNISLGAGFEVVQPHPTSCSLIPVSSCNAISQLPVPAVVPPLASSPRWSLFFWNYNPKSILSSLSYFLSDSFTIAT